MHKLLAVFPALLLMGAVASMTACDGKFAGPPGGSAVGTPGTDPLFGVTPFTFTLENQTVTGFYNDVWYVEFGRESDDIFSASGPYLADTIQTLAVAGFTGYITGGADPTYIEVNNNSPLMVSFMSQWFRRNGDGTRIRERDQFGFLIWSPKSLDINFITTPVIQWVDTAGRFHYDSLRQEQPNAAPGTVLFQWTSPQPNSPGDLPPPQKRFLTKGFSEIGVVMLTSQLAAGAPLISQALGEGISDNTENENIENMGTIPVLQQGNPQPVPQPTGVFGDMYADAYRLAPVLQPTTPGHTEEEAAIEFARHFGSVHVNLIVKAVGLSSGNGGTLTDPAQVVWQNGYTYSFDQQDLNDLNTIHLPGKGRDPNPQVP